MKAVIVRNRLALPPFQKPASQLQFNGWTVESRLRRQLAELGCEIIEVDSFDAIAIHADTLVVEDDILVSNGFLRRFLASIPNRRRNYQCEVDNSRFALLSEKSAPESFVQLPLFYYGQALDAGIETFRMLPAPVHEVAQGMPARMNLITDLRVYFLDFFATQLVHWFDFQAASSLVCREYVAGLLSPLASLFPAWLLNRITSWSWLMERCNSIGKNCRIHPTAILEGCIVGDGVDIGPFAYLRSSVIGNGAVIREKSSLKMSFLGDGGFVMGSDVVNSYIGAGTSIFSPMLYNVVFGERGFLSGGSGFADFIVGSGSIAANIEGKDVPSNLKFLGSAIGDDCFVGANLIFAPGRTIPDGTKLLDHGLIKAMPVAPGGTFVVSGSHLLQVPDGFIGSKRA